MMTESPVPYETDLDDLDRLDRLTRTRSSYRQSCRTTPNLTRRRMTTPTLRWPSAEPHGVKAVRATTPFRFSRRTSPISLNDSVAGPVMSATMNREGGSLPMLRRLG